MILEGAGPMFCYVRTGVYLALNCETWNHKSKIQMLKQQNQGCLTNHIIRSEMDGR